MGKNTEVHEMLERMTDGFYALDEEWRITYANRRAGEILNLKREDYLGRDLWTCFPELVGSIIDQQYRKAIEDKVSLQFECYNETFQSWYEVHVYPSDSGLSVFFKDISLQKKVEMERIEYEKKIEKENKRSLEILERMKQGFFSLDQNFRVTYWNQKAEEHFGISRAQILGLPISNLYNESARNFYLPMLLKVLKEQTSFHTQCICPQNGKWNEVDIYPTEEGCSVFFKNIDESKRTEEELQRLSLIARQTKNIVIITDAAGRITWVNNAFNRITGYSFDEVLGQDPGNFLHGPDTDAEVTKFIAQKSSRGEAFVAETVNYTKSKEKFWVEMHCQPVRDEGGNVVQFFSIQYVITERKMLAAELQAQQKKIHAAVIAAQENERAHVGQELHDNVNQVLTTVKLYTELCRDGIGNTEEILNKSIKLLQNSINEIRSLSKRLSAPCLGKIRLKESVKELVDAVAATGKVSINLDTLGVDKLIVQQEIHLCIYRILQEHLTNILKHAEAKRVQITLEAKNSSIFLLVQDDGKGFDPEKRRSGIGITNMITRAESLKGTLAIISAPGAGCHLEVRLPLQSNHHQVLQEVTMRS